MPQSFAMSLLFIINVKKLKGFSEEFHLLLINDLGIMSPQNVAVNILMYLQINSIMNYLHYLQD